MADDAPVEADLRHDDQEYNPAVEPQKSKAWLNLLLESEKAFEDWNDRCDNIDLLYASLTRLATNTYGDGFAARDKQFAIFWANCEVIKPSIYAKPPVPVVVPKFKDRRPVYQAASEFMERCCIVSFDLTRINDLMLLVRDDVALLSRGVAWCRYESAGEGYYATERVCVDFKARRDFLHSLSPNWREVTWVAAASYLTRSQARERFFPHSGNAYQDADYKVNKESQEVGGGDNRERAAFWEIWDKASRRVVWVAHGCEDILDEDDPHLELQNYFPCPKPAYATTQRGSLVPVPDVMQYKDQLDEINMLTARIHGLADALELKGFYPAGGGEIAEAVETAVKTHSSSRVLVPVANWAAFGNVGKDPIIWMPIDMVSQTVIALVTLRKQIIDDIYQLTGMADIMRGDTDPDETLGAQQLKTQYGTTRIRDKQQELVRLARDLVEISSEIMTQKFKPQTMIEMSQTQLPTTRMVERQVQQLEQQLQQQIQTFQQQMAPPPQLAPPQGPPGPPAGPVPGGQLPPGASPPGGGSPPGGQPPPNPQADQQRQQQMQQAQTQLEQMVTEIEQAQQQVTIEQVLNFLKDNRAKSFVLDIETDSTIMADENGEKQRRTEFVGVLGQLLPQLAQMISADPSTADFCGELLKFATAPFRAGRALDGAIDELVEQMKAKGQGPQGQDPTTAQGQVMLQIETMKDATVRAKNQADAKLAADKLAMENAHFQQKLQSDATMKQMDMSGQAGKAEADVAVQGQKMQESQQAHQAEMAKAQAELQLTQQKAMLMAAQHRMKASDMAARQSERQAAMQMKAQQPPPAPGGI
jgi:hypothetical protein